MKDNQKNQNQNQNDNQSKQILLSVLAVAILVVAVVGVSFAAFTYSKGGSQENKITTGTIKMNYDDSSNTISLTNAMPVSEEVGKAIEAAPTGENGEGEGVGQFDFTVDATITGTTTINYEVAAEKVTITPVEPAEGNGNVGTKQLPDENIRLYLEQDLAGGENYTAVDEDGHAKAFSNAAGSYGTPAEQMVLATNSFTGPTEGTKTHSYRLRMWLDEGYDLKNLIEGQGTEGQKNYKGAYSVKINVYAKAVAS